MIRGINAYPYLSKIIADLNHTTWVHICKKIVDFIIKTYRLTVCILIMNDTSYVDTVKKSITSDASLTKIWSSISQITNLWWALGVEKTSSLSSIKSGIGSGRIISFKDAPKVIEVITGWVPKNHLSYVAVSGLCIDAYHATISLKPYKKKTQISWESVFADKNTDNVKSFKNNISQFYSASLKQLCDGI